MGRFLALVETGQVPNGSVLIVEALDRLSRENVFDAYEIFRRILAGGIEIVTLDDGNRYSADDLRQEWTKLIVVQAIMSRGHNESKMKAMRSTENWSQKKKAAANGSIVTSVGPDWLRMHKGKFTVIEERADVVRRIYQESAEGLGQDKITRLLNQNNIPPFRGGDRWWPSSVAKILTNPAVIGTYQPYKKIGGKRVKDGKEIQGYYPAIIEESLYHRARKARRDRRDGPGKQAGRRGNEFTNILRGLARCGICDASMIYRSGYLFCSANHRGLECPNARLWNYAASEKLVIEGLGRIDWSNVLSSGTATSDLERRISILRGKISDREAERERWAQEFGVGDPFAAGKIREASADIDHLLAELDAAETDLLGTSGKTRDPASRLEQIEALWKEHNELTGDDLYKLRARINVELSRMLEGFEFTAEDILAIYKRSTTTGLGLVRLDFDVFSLVLRKPPKIREHKAPELPQMSRLDRIANQEIVRSDDTDTVSK